MNFVRHGSSGSAVGETERWNAASCERYWSNVVKREGLVLGRARVVADLEDLYVRRLRLPGGLDRVRAIRDALADPDAVIVEIAHDGQLPHLGVVRMVLKAQSIAAASQRGLAVYLIGDHYSADMRPRNLYLGLPLRGVDADRVKTPFTVPVGKHRRHVPFRWLPPPSVPALDALERRAEAWLGHNASYSHRPSALADIKARLHVQFDLLRESATCTTSFGDWLIRVQILWLDALFDGPPERLAVLPMTGISGWVPEVLGSLAAAGPANGSQTPADAAATEEGGLGDFWIYCRTCFRRFHALWLVDRFVGACTSCDAPLEARWPEGAAWVMPDIVAYEIALFRTGISGWVVGSRAGYIEAIRRGYRARFGLDMPPTFLLESVPRFRGLGEPAEGHTRPRLFRVLLEVDPTAIRDALEVPWSADPVLQSPFL